MCFASVLALGLGQRLALDESERLVVYYVALLAWVGCHAVSYEQARWFGVAPGVGLGWSSWCRGAGRWSRCTGRLALPGHVEAVACEECPPLSRLFEQYADGGGKLLVCPICWSARKLDESAIVATASLAGATPMLEWIGDDDAVIFSY